ncbi:hypothetical protein V8F20_005355 [Naviculisporaceae sp. PSN 640]
MASNQGWPLIFDIEQYWAQLSPAERVEYVQLYREKYWAQSSPLERENISALANSLQGPGSAEDAAQWQSMYQAPGAVVPANTFPPGAVFADASHVGDVFQNQEASVSPAGHGVYQMDASAGYWPHQGQPYNLASAPAPLAATPAPPPAALPPPAAAPPLPAAAPALPAAAPAETVNDQEGQETVPADVCPTCGKTWTELGIAGEKVKIERHKARNCKKVRFLCDWCKVKEVSTPDYLKRHQRTDCPVYLERRAQYWAQLERR